MQPSQPKVQENVRPERVIPTPPRVNWWLRMTSTGWDQTQETIEQREKVRRSRLTSWIQLGLLIALVAFIPATFSDRASAFSVAFATLGVLLTIFLNRKGWVTAAGTILVVLTCAAIIGVIVGSPDMEIHLVYLPAYDMLVIPVILGASILPRSAAFIIALVNIGLIYGDLQIQHWAPDLQAAIGQYGILVITGRPVALQILTALIAFLWVRGMDQAVRRADRAEELRSLEQRYLLAETERTARIEEFAQETMKAISALANGQEGFVILPANHPLHQQSIFINMQLKQFYKLKQSNTMANEQIAYAARMLLSMLQRINSGQGISGLDPRQFFTQVPIIDEIAKYLYFMLQGQRVPTSHLGKTTRSDYQR
ncbi:MAG: hypothetical protein J2P36_09185 [Ktedonobacteraceae bacterium]|nr:hypothetical protein [Ktedonobacteraceae bacterium]